MAQLRRQKDQFDERNIRIVVVAFVTDDRAYDWLEQTKSPFPFLLDPDRTVYERYGLKRSLLRSWNLPTLWYYAKELLSGKPIKQIQGDPNQLGGDFLVGPDGRLKLVYPSDDPTDRPSIEMLLAAAHNPAAMAR